MNIKIRKATNSDLSSIQELNNKLFELDKKYDDSLKIGWPFEEKGTKYFTDMINDEFVYVAEEEYRIIGYLAGRINIKNSCVIKSQAEIDNMYILDSYRNHGIGTMLINEFKRYCLENNIEELKVTTYQSNENALNFYKTNGFNSHEITLKQQLK